MPTTDSHLGYEYQPGTPSLLRAINERALLEYLRIINQLRAHSLHVQPDCPNRPYRKHWPALRGRVLFRLSGIR